MCKFPVCSFTCFGHLITDICQKHISEKCGTWCVQFCEHDCVTYLIMRVWSPFNVCNSGITSILWDLGLVSMGLVLVNADKFSTACFPCYCISDTLTLSLIQYGKQYTLSIKQYFTSRLHTFSPLSKYLS